MHVKTVAILFSFVKITESIIRPVISEQMVLGYWVKNQKNAPRMYIDTYFVLLNFNDRNI